MVTGLLELARKLLQVYMYHQLFSHARYSIANGVKDNIQVYNIPKFDGFHAKALQQPPLLADNLKEIEAFSRVSPT